MLAAAGGATPRAAATIVERGPPSPIGGPRTTVPMRRRVAVQRVVQATDAARPAGGLFSATVNIQTHRELDPALCGRPLEVAPGRAEVELTTRPNMRADDSGLVHGGFVFGLADHAAMLAVNEPTVVLGSADTRFVAPVRVGDVLVASAEVGETKGTKRIVTTQVHRRSDATVVMTGTLVCFVLPEHVLAGASQEASP